MASSTFCEILANVTLRICSSTLIESEDMQRLAVQISFFLNKLLFELDQCGHQINELGRNLPSLSCDVNYLSTVLRIWYRSIASSLPLLNAIKAHLQACFSLIDATTTHYPCKDFSSQLLKLRDSVELGMTKFGTIAKQLANWRIDLGRAANRLVVSSALAEEINERYAFELYKSKMHEEDGSTTSCPGEAEGRKVLRRAATR